MTTEEILEAQNAWGTAVKAGDADTLLSLYDFENPNGPLLFKPTISETVRIDRAGTLSYFVGGDPRYPLDTGFVKKGWVRVEFNSAAGPVFQVDGLVANDMGEYLFVDGQGNEARANYTFAYRKVSGAVRIILHHSSFVYEPGE